MNDGSLIVHHGEESLWLMIHHDGSFRGFLNPGLLLIELVSTAAFLDGHGGHWSLVLFGLKPRCVCPDGVLGSGWMDATLDGTTPWVQGDNHEW